MEYKIDVGRHDWLTIKACEFYSNSYLKVEKGEVYEFYVDASERWKDWFIKSDANGFMNIFLLNRKKRVPGHPCFMLCGTYDANEENHFPIGLSRKHKVKKSCLMHFFANDHKNRKYYKNNKGEVKVLVKRVV